MVRAFLLSLAVCGMLVACSDDSGDVPSSPGEVTAAGQGSCPAEISDRIASLFPGGLENAATQQCNNVERKLSKGDLDDAILKTFNLIDFAVKHYENGKLEDPAGGDPPTTEEALTELLNALLVFVGLDPIFAGSFDFEICEANTKCVFETETEFAGISATFTEPTLVTVTLLPNDTFTPTGVTGFPLIFDFSATSSSGAVDGPSFGLTLASSPLAEPATVAVCVVDPPDPAAPDEDELANLALGHIIQGSEGDGVEILPDAPPGDFALDCTDASSGEGPEVDIASLRWWGERAASAFEPVSDFLVAPLLANPGERRGLITAFSPVGAVDTRTVGNGEPELIPTTTSLELENENSCCGFITTATATVSEDTEGGDPVESGDVEFVIDDVEGENDQSTVRSLDDGGTADLDIVCDGETTSDDQIAVPLGSYTIQALFLGTTTHEESSSEPQDFDCSLG
ncbi:MAG: hypothetical protein ACREMD_05105 [Gemmatimonadota bacterium]